MKIFLLRIMAAAYVLAGVNHFWHPQFYLKIMPPYLPFHHGLNAAVGVAEIGLGALLLVRRSRSAAAWGLVVLLVVIFPANVQMAINYAREDHPQTRAAFVRLPLQAVLVWWALRYTRWYQKRVVEKPGHSPS